MIEKPAANEDNGAQAVTPAVDDSADTTVAQQSPESEAPAAGEQGTDEATESSEAQPATGEPTVAADDAGEEAKSGTETADTKAERKSRTAKRFNEVLDQNRQLREQLKATLGSQFTGKPATPAPAQAAPALGQAPAASEANKPEYWANLYHQEQDPVRKSEYAKQYEAARESQLEERAVHRIRQEMQQQKQVEFLANQLADLNEITPIFQPGTTQLDQSSPLIVAAMNQANQNGQPITSYPELLFWANKAAIGFVSQGGLKAKAEVKKAQVKLQQAVAKTGLESTNRVAAIKSPQDLQSRMKSLRDKAVKGDQQASRELTRLQLGAHLSA